MSDKSKRLRDDAEQRRRFDELAAHDQAKGDTLPRCLCGLTYTDTEIICSSPDRWKPEAFYCRVCAPPDIRDLCWPAGN